MAGIVGIALANANDQVEQMLQKIIHRGRYGRKIFNFNEATLAANWTSAQADSVAVMEAEHMVCDYIRPGHFAEARLVNGKLVLSRDYLGLSPLYYGWNEQGALCFASEVKAILPVTQVVHLLPPGNRYVADHCEPFDNLEFQQALVESADYFAVELKTSLTKAVIECISSDTMGAWLSGGLDSSAIASLARLHVSTLHTFSAGLAGAPDLEYAREVADFIQSRHHELNLRFDDMLSILPEVIYHLESFDALLVRSSVVHYLVAGLAADHVPEVFSGEGGDELFAGYEYLKSIDIKQLPQELVDITRRLHNTALQRVDRSASAHGIIAHVPFLDPKVVELALQIPVNYKINNKVEKWIVRQVMKDLLPERILNRTKAKFWEGAGVGELLQEYANAHISDNDFSRECHLPNGWRLNSKEELLYYRLFCDHFGELKELDWMGRTKMTTV